jgi:hypothetical protein
MTRRSEIRLKHSFGTDDLSDAAAVGLPLTPRPVGTYPGHGVPTLPTLEAHRVFPVGELEMNKRAAMINAHGDQRNREFARPDDEGIVAAVSRRRG